MRYQFIVVGSVPDTIAEQVPEMASAPFPPGGTALFGPVQDEADILTMLARLVSLGLSVIDMRPLPD
ncbi:hypothetical protein [Fodinibacter luteus]|uniref:hypothetical protein n=1 Tax=Fodinibacter luteus TaxID=552064 RepID=UPI0031EED791